ncbi:carboxymuconolactone decarboxylase family protein [Sneathiella marina]|uniref:Carboxymuconolactone decarboxylase family protein n=1 Tax=Sneathiella marina TaxID=2950108 RepID=A0ABY4W9R2_9PROT|nr:carboxymuconolactone decarboxylase family protein [Sneathiella marina]USG62873.1 carboxymuconolactone decarboxylase family protein [Sneathiella marina]
MTNRLLPLEEPFTNEIEEVLSRYPAVDGKIIALFRTFANSRRFLEKGVPNLLDDNSPLGLKDREIVILRVTANTNCEYEWGVHVAVFGKKAGFTEGQFADICQSSINRDLWSPEECLLLNVVDQLCFRGNIGQPDLEEFQHRYTADTQLEIFALCGTYHTVSFVANAANLAPEPFAARFPSRD